MGEAQSGKHAPLHVKMQVRKKDEEERRGRETRKIDEEEEEEDGRGRETRKMGEEGEDEYER